MESNLHQCGRTLLHLIAMENAFDAAEVLIRSGADISARDFVRISYMRKLYSVYRYYHCDGKTMHYVDLE